MLKFEKVINEIVLISREIANPINLRVVVLQGVVAIGQWKRSFSGSKGGQSHFYDLHVFLSESQRREGSRGCHTRVTQKWFTLPLSFFIQRMN